MKPGTLGKAGAGPTRLRALWVVYQRGKALDPPECHVLLPEGYVIGREPGRNGITVEDNQISRVHLRLSWVGEYGLFRVSDAESTNGSSLDGVPLTSDYLRPGAVLRIGDSLLVYNECEQLPGLPTPDVFTGVALGRAQAESLAETVAPSELPVLVHGPTGAGKERLVAHLHASSGRQGPLVPLNCAAIPAHLLESELFGHVRGAFSGANTQRKGLFVEADRGTIFLDEIAELPMAQQAALLRVLQEGKVRPVGSDREIPVHVRVVAATHQDLEQAAEDGRFRSDLYARLAGITISLPGLAERREEVLRLFWGFLKSALPTCPELTTDAAERLLTYSWPRNVRELKLLADRIAVFAPRLSSIGTELLPESMRRPAAPDGASEAQTSSMPERGELERLLGEHQGNVAAVARVLGQHRQQVYRWLKALGIDARGFRGGR